jgi:FkbM family methyltransferase
MDISFVSLTITLSPAPWMTNKRSARNAASDLVGKRRGRTGRAFGQARRRRRPATQSVKGVTLISTDAVENLANSLDQAANGITTMPNLTDDSLKAIENKELFWREIEQDLISCLVNKGDTAIDIGANTGSYVKTFVDCGCACIAFECNPRLYKFLLKRFQDYGHVVVKSEAVSSVGGVTQMRIPLDGLEESDGGSTIEALNMLQGHVSTRSVDVKLCKLDDIIDMPVALIKIDVEGHEIEVLKGASRVIDRWNPTLVVECEERHRPGTIAELFEFMAQRGYRGTFIERLRLREIKHFDLSMQDAAALQTNAPRRFWGYVNNFIFIHKKASVRAVMAIERKLDSLATHDC